MAALLLTLNNSLNPTIVLAFVPTCTLVTGFSPDSFPLKCCCVSVIYEWVYGDEVLHSRFGYFTIPALSIGLLHLVSQALFLNTYG